MKLLFCGDIMPGGVLPYQERYIDDNLHAYMKGFDLRVGTLECAIGSNFLPAPEKLKDNGGNNNICFARDEDFFRIKELGFDALSLGNNHSFDLGEAGLKNTIRHLCENNIAFFGAGMNLAEASTPAVIKLQDQTLCFIGCCIKGLSPVKVIAATECSYGVYQPTIEELVKQINSLSGRYDKLIVMPHWGEEHILLPPYKCVEYAKKMIDAGADAVFGSHSHRVSTNLNYKGKPIIYGLGNFLYPDTCLEPPRPFYYPESTEEMKSLRLCVNYPKSVRERRLLVWSEDSRVGIAAAVTIDQKKLDVERILIRMGKDNVLRFLKNDSKTKNLLLKIGIYFASVFTQPTIYRLSYRLTWRIAAYINTRNLGDFKKDI